MDYIVSSGVVGKKSIAKLQLSERQLKISDSVTVFSILLLNFSKMETFHF